MEDTRVQVDRRGTARDWPVLLIALGAGLGIATGGDKAWVLLFWFGIVALLLRRGTFSARRRD